MHSAQVFCCVCGEPHNPRRPDVSYRSGDGRWWCTDELACWGRARDADAIMQQHLANVAAMYRALENVWADLEASGWKL